MISQKPTQVIFPSLKRFFQDHGLLLAIILTGLTLRLYHLGDNCLRFDEVGVSYVTKARTLDDFVFLVRSHVMAMPLDYAVTWLISHMGTGNEILRLPSAIWGTLTLPVFFALVQEFTNRRTALFSVFLLAIAPFHIQYSQELRFYASLTFFYTLSTYTLWKAMNNNTIRSWVVFTLTTITGLYFHMYVLLVVVNAVFFLIAGDLQRSRGQILRPLMASSTLILVAFLAGFLIFSGRVTFNNPLLEYDVSFLKSLLIGLGWQPFYFETAGYGWIWGLVCCALEIAGLACLLRKPRSAAALLIISVIVQAIVIIGADLFKHYFFSPRQLLPFYPILLMVAATGVTAFMDVGSALQDKFSPALKQGLFPATLSVILLASAAFPALSQYYSSTKSNALSISEYIHSSWEPGSTVLVMTPFYGSYYNYFFTDVLDAPEIVPSVWQADWDTVRQSRNWPGRTYVIAPLYLDADQQDSIVSGRYSLVPLPYPASRFIQQLWIRD